VPKKVRNLRRIAEKILKKICIVYVCDCIFVFKFKIKVMRKEEFKKGDQLNYRGRGFIGYNPKDKTMIFNSVCYGSNSDIFVEYNNQIMLVSLHEVEALK
jgi:hypothetical protein